MRIPRITIALAATGVVTALVLTGCEDGSAQARADAQAEIESAAAQFRDLTLLRMEPGADGFESHKSELASLERTLSGIRDASEGQVEAISMLEAGVARELARVTLAEARVIEREQRAKRRLLHQRLAAAGRLLALASGRAAMDDSAPRQYLDGMSTVITDVRREESNMLAELDGPIAELTEDNRVDNAEAERLAADANSLRREAAELGDADGFTTFEKAVEQQRAADLVESRIANRELDLDYDLLPEHRLAELRIQSATEMLEAIDRTLRELETFVASNNDDAGRTRDAAEALVSAIGDELAKVAQADEMTLAGLYDEVRTQLGKARTAARKGSKVAQAHIAAQRGEVSWSQLRGLDSHAILLEEVANAQIGDQYAQQLEAMNAKRTDLRNEASEAYREAKSLLASAGNSTAVTSFNASVDAALNALDAAGGGMTLGLQGQGEETTQNP